MEICLFFQMKLKWAWRDMFNLDLGDDVDVSSPEKFHSHLQEKLRELAENQSQEQLEAPVNQGKKTKKQLEKEARQQ